MRKTSRKTKEIDVGEISLEQLKKEGPGESRMELSLPDATFSVFNICVLLAGAVLIAELFFLNVVKADFWQVRSLSNVNRIIPERAKRGIIFDKDGGALVENVPRFDAYLLPLLLPPDLTSRKSVIETLKKNLGISEEQWEETIKQNKDSSVIPLKKNLSLEKVILLKSLDLSGLRIEENTNRHYFDGLKFSHLLGYIGVADEKDLADNPQLDFGDSIGETGLEAYYDNFLRGQNGKINLKTDAKNNFLEETLMKEPVNGYQLYTTIDAGLQKFSYDALQTRLNELGRKAGLVLVLNPQNGQVLSLVSLPSFDNNIFESDNNELINSILSDNGKPIFNRAIAGAYSPGSTIKPIVAYGALNEGLIDDKKTIYSPGFLEVPNPFNPDQPSIFLDWKPHGNVDLYSALARSCNVYFYSIGGGTSSQRGLGIEKLKSYWQKFGLGVPTGIDLISEARGFLPDPSNKSGEPWRLGDTYNVSIGQGDLLVTPIQLINYITAIANGGKIYQPYLVSEIKNENNEIIKENKPKVLLNIDKPDILNLIKKGMVDAVRQSYGTAYPLSDLPISVAAKTGTAQIAGNTKINALFAGFAPAEKPEIAVLVLIENAQEGYLNAVPVAKEIFLWYYKNRLQV